MMELLKITSLRKGASSNAKAENAANYDESKANPFPKLPDPLVLKNGKKVTTAEMWVKERRPEILKFYQTEIYGRIPENTPKVKWEITETDDKARDGTAIMKHVVGRMNNDPDGPKMNMTVFLPAKATEPVPMILAISFGFGGGGISISLATLANSAPAIISGIEIQADDPFGLAAPSFNLELSGDNGATWSPLASNLSADRFGRGSYPWTIPANQPLGSQYLIRATSNDGVHAQGVSTSPFLITNSGHDYYVNDASTTGDVLTTVVGNSANSGKSPDQPMANLAALIAAYSLGPSDVVHVDTGTYNLLRTVVLTAQHSGVEIAGPTAATALLQRGLTGPASTFIPRLGSVVELRGAANVTLDHLSLTNAFSGIYAADDAGATGLTVSSSAIFGINNYGVYLGRNNDRLTITGSTLYGLPGGDTTDDQLLGIYYLGSDGRFTGRLLCLLRPPGGLMRGVFPRLDPDDGSECRAGARTQAHRPRRAYP
jgi:hypothetical protein